MKKKLRRSIVFVTIYSLSEIALVRNFIGIWNPKETDYLDIANIFVVIALAFLIFRYLRPYMVIDEVSVLIYHDFTKESFLISEVAHVELDEGRITLKNGKILKFQPIYLRNNGMQVLRQVFETLG